MPVPGLSYLRAAAPVIVGGATGSLVLIGALAQRPAFGVAAAFGAAFAAAATARWLRRTADGRAARVPADASDDGWMEAARQSSASRGSAARDVVGQFLRDARTSLGTEEAVFWQVAADGEGLCAAAWASGGVEPLVPADPNLLSVIAWSAHEGAVQVTAAAGGRALLAAAPVSTNGTVLGALSVHGQIADGRTVDVSKRELARHAARLGDVVDLTHTRLEFELESQRGQHLLQAAQEFQALRSVAELGRAICAAGMGVTAADRVAVVRWNAGEATGRVESSYGVGSVSSGQDVTAESLVGRACAEGLPQLWEDARLLDATAPIFAQGVGARAVGSLGIVPLVGREGVVGAVTVETTRPGGVRPRDVRSVKLLAALAAVSLETVADFEVAERVANTDKLTGLPNRRAFEAQFGPAIYRADRFGEPVAVVMCDVDHFKGVNDSHGHEVGDAVLKRVGAVLQRGVRTVDCCARFGGEEFMLLLPRTNRAGASELAERLRRAIEFRPIRAGGQELRVTASFGVAVYPATVTSRDELLGAADRALYQAKRDGRNCVRCADATAVFD